MGMDVTGFHTASRVSFIARSATTDLASFCGTINATSASDAQSDFNTTARKAYIINSN